MHTRRNNNSRRKTKKRTNNKYKNIPTSHLINDLDNEIDEMESTLTSFTDMFHKTLYTIQDDNNYDEIVALKEEEEEEEYKTKYEKNIEEDMRIERGSKKCWF